MQKPINPTFVSKQIVISESSYVDQLIHRKKVDDGRGGQGRIKATLFSPKPNMEPFLPPQPHQKRQTCLFVDVHFQTGG